MCISSLVFTLNSSCAWLLTYLCIKLLLVHMVVLWYRSRKMRTKCHFREHLKEQNGNTKSQQWTLRARQCQYQNIPTTRWGYQIIFFIWFTFPKLMPEKKATKKHPIKGNSRQYRHFYTITKAQLFFACRLTVSHWKWKRLKIFLASHAKQITIVLIWNVSLNVLWYRKFGKILQLDIVMNETYLLTEEKKRNTITELIREYMALTTHIRYTHPQ